MINSAPPEDQIATLQSELAAAEAELAAKLFDYSVFNCPEAQLNALTDSYRSVAMLKARIAKLKLKLQFPIEAPCTLTSPP